MSSRITPQDTQSIGLGLNFWKYHFAKRMLHRQLQKIVQGRFIVYDGVEKSVFGDLSDDCQLHATIYVKNPQFYAKIIFSGPGTGAGESYMQGMWECDDLTSVIRIFVANRATLLAIDSGLALLYKFVAKTYHLLNRNSKRGSTKNIEAHYDIGNDFFRLFLDKSLMYSSAIFPSRDSSLDEAAAYKLKMICEQLQLTANDHLLEIGSGWGGLAIYAAKHYDCTVTSATISKKQYQEANYRVNQAGLSNKVNIIFCDYRDLVNQYDKIVSVEMLEAVGHQYYKTFFSQCNKLLKPGGLMLLQTITIAEPLYERAKKSVDFIQRYIFPGGCLPSMSVLKNNIKRFTNFQQQGINEFPKDYALTLRHWHERFMQNKAQVRKLGYSENFIRMWEYYLCYCEGGFLEESISVAQLLLSKNN